MANLSFIIGIIGNVISIMVFASPMKTFWGVIKKKSTENYKGVPYITTLLSTSLWTFYGILNPDGLLVMTVNGAGAIFQLIYVTLFLIYAPKDKKVKTAKLVAVLDVGFLGAVIAVTLLAIHGKTRLTFVGILCAALTIGMYAAPLAAMKTVIKTKSVEYMPFLLSFFLFLNAGVWSAYSVLVKDIYIGVPNAIGFVLGSAQLILYFMYKNKSVSAKSTEAMEEEGSAHLVKGGIEMNSLEEDLKNRASASTTMAPSLSFIVGIIGNVISILVFASPMTIFWKVVKKKSTEHYKVVPYITTLLCTSLWTFYGLLKPGGLLILTVNGAGAIFQFIYVTLFLLYCPHDKKARTTILVAILDVGFPVAAILLTHSLLDGYMRIDVAGLLCVVFSMISYGSPLAAMKTVVRTKSVEFMPFLLSLILFINGGIWTLYAVPAKDYFVGLLLYAMYWKPKKKMSDILEEGLQQQPLIIPASNCLAETSADWRP
ncbi:hypothetical protein PTKIN_Ptkin01aG0313700 [Pterospermum kingtungense]